MHSLSASRRFARTLMRDRSIPRLTIVWAMLGWIPVMTPCVPSSWIACTSPSRWLAVLVSITSTPVMSRIAKRARVPTIVCSPSSIAPSQSSSAPSQTDVVGAERVHLSHPDGAEEERLVQAPLLQANAPAPGAAVRGAAAMQDEAIGQAKIELAAAPLRRPNTKASTATTNATAICAAACAHATAPRSPIQGTRSKTSLFGHASLGHYRHGYFEEQLLSSSLFRLYRSLGGDTRATGADSLA